MTIQFTKNIEIGMDKLHKQGAFLTTKHENIINTMTISWGSIGFEWNRPIFTVLIRKSRFTHEIIEKSNEFTISIPLTDSLKDALLFCGTKSGKSVDKFKGSNLILEDSKSLLTPIIGNCELHYECKVVYKQDMDPNFMHPDLKQKNYTNEDYHTIYYGEIVDSYIK